VYATDQEFFDLFLSQMFARNKQFRWCLQWADHEEAAFVVKILHDTYEATVLGPPVEMAVWLRDYAYVLLMDRLCTDSGTFSSCDWQSDRHKAPLPLRSATE
jgi:hypothetical protein